MLRIVKRICTIHFFVLINTLVFSQTTTIPTTVSSGTQYDFTGRDLVKFQQGVLYKASGTTSLKARIDENIVVPINNEGGSVSETSSSRSLDKSLSVGSIQDNFEVSLSGSANYNMQIVTPPGTNGMQPNISLSYNSNGGEGYMGIGWSISGLSRISRTGKNMYSDNVQAMPIQYNASDVFELDGNRLVLTNNGWYSTEVESFQKITISASGSFQVETKDGIIMEYGNTGDSRRVVGGVVVDWYLNKVMDKFGNYYTYTYRSSNGTIQPISIDYTMNYSNSVTIDSYNKITFVYDTKPAGTETPVYENGTLITNNMLLKEIRVYAEGKRSNTYVLNYNFDDTYIHLVDVQRTGANGEKMNKTVFNWSVATGINHSSSTEDNLPDPTDHAMKSIVYGNFNGKGIAKYPIYEYSVTQGSLMFNKIKLYNCKTSITTSVYNIDTKLTVQNKWVYDGLTKLSNGGATSAFQGADFDGNGLNDCVILQANSSSKGGYTMYAYTSNGSSFTEETNTIPLTNVCYTGGNFTGNGRSGILTISDDGMSGKLYYYDEVNKSVFGKSRTVALNGLSSTYYINIYGISILTMDFNGDGYTDFVAQMSDRSAALFVYNPATNNFDCTRLPFQMNYTHIGDFNGDGLDDIINAGSIYLSNGKSFEAAYQPTFNLSSSETMEEFVDFNGDGKTDILTFENQSDFNGNITSYINVYFSKNGKDFIKKSILAPGSTCVNTTTGVGYENNFYYNHTLTSSLGNISLLYFQQYLNSSTCQGYNITFSYYGNKIKTITDGFNNSKIIAYTKSGITSAGTYPLVNISGISVVSSDSTSTGVINSAGVQTYKTTNYGFSNAKFGITGKGFCGFESTTNSTELVINPWTKLCNYYTFSFDNTYCIPLRT